jgi:hypothetical protein
MPALVGKLWFHSIWRGVENSAAQLNSA